ncbi:metallopeptidase family protein [Amycolatopsis sp. NPDC059021]|uniref:metallopeptidase family protein n=1 Tax=Amycolatopsis sp. NPDC059021 TaxID=3346704 RepID=UPI00366CBCA3
MPVEMTRHRFEELVSEALDEVPPEFAEAMDNVVVLVEEFNEEEPSILGLYHGVALTERTSDYGGVLPDRISIYRRPILEMCESEEHVVEEVLVTVMHELGHHFGIDDARLHELGWG